MSIHDDVNRTQADKAFKDPEMVRVIGQYLAKMAVRDFDHLDAVVQKWRYPFDMYDAYAFQIVHGWLCDGKVCMVQISVDGTPSNDKDIEHQNRILSKIRRPFRAKFWGGLADSDGEFSWDETIGVTQFPFVTMPELREDLQIGPRTVPLEVGYTLASRTALHLWEDGAVARWPYGHDRITLFVTTSGRSLWHERLDSRG